MAKKKSFWDKFKDSVMSMGDETAGPSRSSRKAKPKKAAAKKRSTSKARSKPKAKAKKRSTKKRR